MRSWHQGEHLPGADKQGNGLTRDLQGRLIACEQGSRRVTWQKLDGTITVIANRFQGRQLNRPNDLVTMHLLHRSVDEPDAASAIPIA